MNDAKHTICQAKLQASTTNVMKKMVCVCVTAWTSGRYTLITQTTSVSYNIDPYLSILLFLKSILEYSNILIHDYCRRFI